jgi:hypothetical protein
MRHLGPLTRAPLVLCPLSEWGKCSVTGQWPLSGRFAWGLAVDLPHHRILCADVLHSTVFTVDMDSKAVTTLLAPSSYTAPGESVRWRMDLHSVLAVVVDPTDGALFVGAQNAIVRLDEKTGACAMVAGDNIDRDHHLRVIEPGPGPGPGPDGRYKSGQPVDGIGSTARLHTVHSLVIDSHGTLYAADCHNGAVRRATRVPCAQTAGGWLLDVRTIARLNRAVSVSLTRSEKRLIVGYCPENTFDLDARSIAMFDLMTGRVSAASA